MQDGDRFDQYLLKQKIAQGGMAEIYRAERLGAMNISREVCIKCVRPALCTDPDFVRMFIDEARISSTLRHSNIVSIDHFGVVDGTLFSCMEWVHGTDAARVLRRASELGQRLPIDVAVFIVAEVLKALEYAHAKSDNGAWLQIVHRDVTPHNVMVSYTGEVKLTDFGIARATSRLHHTQGDLIKGKVAYMAPEQATGGALDNRTDLFAVGIVAYELLTGQRPFQGATQIDGVHAMLQGQRAPLRALRPDAPPELEAVVDTLLATLPDGRYPDAGAALDALNHVPALVSGQRSLQRLMREYFPSEQSTVLPRFTREATPAKPAPTPALGDGHSESSPTTPRHTPPQPVATAPQRLRTDPLPVAERTNTAAGAHAYDATLVAQPPVAVITGPAAVVTAPVHASSGRGRGALFAGLAVALIASLSMLAFAWVRYSDTQTPQGPAAQPPQPTPQAPVAPPPQPPPQPPVARLAQSPPQPPVAQPTPQPPIAQPTPQAPVVVVDAGAPSQEAMATITVVAIPWGQITINGSPVEARRPVRRPPGTYRIVATQNDRVIRRRVTLRAGEDRTVECDFRGD